MQMCALVMHRRGHVILEKLAHTNGVIAWCKDQNSCILLHAAEVKGQVERIPAETVRVRSALSSPAAKIDSTYAALHFFHTPFKTWKDREVARRSTREPLNTEASCQPCGPGSDPGWDEEVLHTFCADEVQVSPCGPAK